MPYGPGARGERWSAIGLVALALAYLYAARHYALDTLAAPGPGLVPLVAGLALLLLAAGQLLISARRPLKPADRAAADPTCTPVAGSYARRRRILMVCLLVAYVASLGVLGFLASSFLLVVLAARLMGAADWWRPALLAFGVTLGSHLIFVVWLGVPLPPGPFR